MAHSGVWPNGTQYRGEIFYVACNHFPKIGNTCMYELQVQRKVPYDVGTRVMTQSQRVGPTITILPPISQYAEGDLNKT